MKRIYAADRRASRPRHPEIEFVKASYLRDHPLVLDAFVDRIGEGRDEATGGSRR